MDFGDFMLGVKILLILVVFAIIITAPIALIMYISNNKKRVYFKKLSELWRLEFDSDVKSKFSHAALSLKGSIKNKYININQVIIRRNLIVHFDIYFKTSNALPVIKFSPKRNRIKKMIDQQSFDVSSTGAYSDYLDKLINILRKSSPIINNSISTIYLETTETKDMYRLSSLVYYELTSQKKTERFQTYVEALLSFTDVLLKER